MSLVFTILLGVAVLVGLVATFLTIKNWHWAQMLLMLGIFLASVGAVFLSAEVLRIHKLLRMNLPRLEAQLEDLETRNRALQTGARDPAVINAVLNDLRDPEGIAGRLGNDEAQQATAEELRALAGNKRALDRLTAMVDKLGELGDLPSLAVWNQRNAIIARQRGRAWFGASPAGPVAPNGQVQVAVPVPRPHGIDKDSIVYVFEMDLPLPDAAPAQYLGEYRVVESSGDGVVLSPVLPLEPRSLQRLAASKRPWRLYATMPADRHELFAGLSEEQLRQMMPPSTVEEYVRHGGPVDVNDDEYHRQSFNEEGLPIGPESTDKVAEERYNRPLRAYEVLFNRLAEKRVNLLTQIAAKKDEIVKLGETEAKGQQLQAERSEEKRKLLADQERMQRDLATIRKLSEAIAGQLAVAKQGLVDGLAANAQLAAELARRQMAFLGAAAQ
ncbi:MAG: hypothetical protein KF688_09810 [Pirellulales bacterium]|nr:hypothetical protein [Pirellulales bacterium]